MKNLDNLLEGVVALVVPLLVFLNPIVDFVLDYPEVFGLVGGLMIVGGFTIYTIDVVVKLKRGYKEHLEAAKDKQLKPLEEHLDEKKPKWRLKNLEKK